MINQLDKHDTPLFTVSTVPGTGLWMVADAIGLGLELVSLAGLVGGWVGTSCLRLAGKWGREGPLGPGDPTLHSLGCGQAGFGLFSLLSLGFEDLGKDLSLRLQILHRGTFFGITTPLLKARL